MTGNEAGGNDRRDGGPATADRLREGASRFRSRWRPVSRAVERGVSHSRTGVVAGRVREGVERSRLVQWLTREPDPDVIVVDLAETRTVGPVIAVLERVATAVARPFAGSTARTVRSRTVRVVERNAVPAASGALLGLVVGTLALTYDGASAPWLLALAIAGVAGLLGLTVDRSRAVLADSTVAGVLAAAVAPPADEAGTSDGG